MGTYDYTKGAVAANLASGQKVSVVEQILDFPAIAAARAAAGQAALAADDILKLIAVKAGQYVQLVIAEVITPEGETATFDVGDGVTVDGFLDGANGNSAGFYVSEKTEAYAMSESGGKFYTTDDTIDIKLLTAAYNTAKIRIAAVVIDMRSDNLG
jgi:hypothetical protein